MKNMEGLVSYVPDIAIEEDNAQLILTDEDMTLAENYWINEGVTLRVSRLNKWWTNVAEDQVWTKNYD